MVLAEDDPDVEDALRHTASMLQARQLITNNAMTKRKEQLNRWATSEMNGASTSRKRTKVQFHDADIFLSACMSGDEDEVDELLGKGADINTATVDGLTALHQSVIDSKPEMVRFLCEKGADVNAQDNEGWTPLHAAACCGNVAIVKFLCHRGADLTIINSDKELALDLAEDESCREFLENDYKNKGIDPDKCRERELTCMMEDVQRWMRDGAFGDVPHPRTGATALHVAAAKGYTQLMEMLIKAGADVRREDNDGWTPLHAAAHWGEKDSCKILLEHGASVTSGGSEGQSVLAVADKEIVEYLEELERTVVKRRIPSLPPPSVLAEKNVRVEQPEGPTPIGSAPTGRITPTHAHFLSSEQKHALALKDEREEAEALHSGAKHPRLSERSPEEGSEETAEEENEEEEEEEQEEELASLPASEVSPERMSVERSQSASSAIGSPAKEKSVEMSPEVVVRQLAARTTVTIPDRTVTDRSPSSAASSVASYTAQRKQSSSSSENAAVSATATLPLRSAQQPSLWINRGVPLTSSRTPSLGSTASCSEEASASGSGSGAYSRSASTSSRSGSASVVSEEASSEAASSPRSTPSEHSSCLSEATTASTSQESEPASSEAASSAGSAAESVPSTSSGAYGASAPVSAVSSGAGSPTVQLTFRPPNCGVPASGATVARSASTPSSLPWVRAATSSSASSTSSMPPPSNTKTPYISFLSKDRVSAFRPPPKTAPAPVPSSNAAPASPSSRPAFKPQPLPAPLMRPWQTTNANATNESEAERRKEARMHRQFRRSTQGVTKEQLEEASRVAAEEQARRKGLRGVRLASEEKDTSPETEGEREKERESLQARPNTAPATATSPSTSATLTLPSAAIPPHATPSAANIRRKNQTAIRGVAVAPVASRTQTLKTATNSQPQQNGQLPSPSLSSTSINYKTLYEQQKAENDRLRREMEEQRKQQMNGASARRASGASASGTPSATASTTSRTASSGVSRSASGSSLDDQERRQYERRISELEYELKSLSQLRLENQRLKEENGALVRVISKMTI